jgi:uncharacterized protein YgbK (DUF1537 family)
MSAPDLTALAPEWPENLLAQIRQRVRERSQSIVVLDDDPTGTQTVYDTPVLTEWSEDSLTEIFHSREPLAYILTNSRSVPASESARIHREVAASLLAAKRATGRDYCVISRSDSTLRGHFPLETDVLAASLGEEDAVCLVIPFFEEGGRWTVNDVHYVVEGEVWTPAGETPFAQDASFGFRASNLREWVEEKTQGRHQARDVHSLDLDTLRRGPEAALAALRQVPSGAVCVVNALTMRDIEVVVTALLDAEDQGRRFLFRTAASFVRARAGLAKRPLLQGSDLLHPDTSLGGLVVVGSHVPKTTRQLEVLLQGDGITPIEIDVPEWLAQGALHTISTRLREALASGSTTVVYTSRTVVTGDSEDESLGISQRVSQGLVNLVRSLPTSPRFLIAKGGITSSDLATKALNVRRALVRGQLLPGIPVWELGQEARFPGLPYIVFPGNVGGDEALWHAVQRLQPTTTP